MKIAGVTVKRGETKQIKLAIAKLTSGTEIDVPVIVSRGSKDGPVLLLMAGLHGDEINSVDVVRTIIEQKLNHVDSGTVICVPILNVFGFINFSREVPDGKDVNRSFPGHSKGSLASQIAYHLINLYYLIVITLSIIILVVKAAITFHKLGQFLKIKNVKNWQMCLMHLLHYIRI